MKKKFDVVTLKSLKDGKISASIVCEDCGLPITVTNEYGMFCKNRCGEKESIKASKKAKIFLSDD